jgi:hypothetical protein
METKKPFERVVSQLICSTKNGTHGDNSLGHSKKGYTNGEIGIEWIKHFDNATKTKANGRRRLLLVDGHNSHYTRGFLEYARQNRISIVCYPSHSTHIYQGLDVVIFSVLKRAWSKNRDEYERETGKPVNKSNFLSVYAKAHIEAFTSTNIKAAFRVTGVEPFNPDVIPESALAPSQTTSTEAGLPIPPQTPVRIMSDMINRVLARQFMLTETPSSPTQKSDLLRDEDPFGAILTTPIRVAVDEISASSARHLFSHSPLKSSSSFPLFKPHTISPFQNRNLDLFELEPTSERERQLQTALADAESRDGKRKHAMIDMQSVTVLQNAYVRRVNRQLHAQEDEDEHKKNKNKRFKGKSKLLTGDDFFSNVVEVEEKAEREKKEKEDKRARRDQHAQALVEWKTQEEQRKSRNEAIRQKYHEAVNQWEEERDQAKANRKRAPLKPKMGKLEPGVPRPKVEKISESEEDGNDEEDEAEDESDDE